MRHTFVEENKIFKIETDKADAFITLNPIYHKTILSDVDLIIIDGNTAILMEYKNSNIPNAAKPEIFDSMVKTDDHYMKIARKYYDSMLYISNINMKFNNKKYYYVLEAKNMDSVLRKIIAGKIKKKLPFNIHKELGLAQTLVDEFHVVSIEDWNKTFKDYSFTAVT